MMMVDLVRYRRATREDVEARYPVVVLNRAEAMGPHPQWGRTG